MKRLSLILFVVFLAIVAAQDAYVRYLRNRKIEPRNYTVVLSLDGFRFDYQEIANTPTLDSIQQYGVRAAGLQPVFPSLTFTNHYTIATGLYAENHGIVANRFFDRQSRKYFDINDAKTTGDNYFYQGEPIWVTAESQRIKSAVNMWVGANVNIKGYQPSRWAAYDGAVPYKARIDSVISWLKSSYNQRPHLAMCYIEEVDNVGHTNGPDSPEMVKTIQFADSLVGYFVSQLKTLSFSDSINFIIVSDHGMAPISEDKSVDIEPFIKDDWIDTVSYSPAISLFYCKKDCADSVCRALKNVEGVSVIKRSDVDTAFHYSANNRIGDVIVLADSGMCLKYKDKRTLPGGMHGFDNRNPLMNGIFYAIGPDFKNGYAAPQLYNTDIYELLCRLLEIAPAHSDGKMERIECVLK